MLPGSAQATLARVGSRPVWHSSTAALATWVLGVSSSALAAALMVRAHEAPLYVAAFSLRSVIAMTAGLIAWRRRTENPTGRLLMAIGLLANLSMISLESTVSSLEVVGHVIAGSEDIVVVYVLLTYPWGALSNRFDRWVVAAAVVLFLGVGTAAVVIMGTCPYCVAGYRGSEATSFLQVVESVLAACFVAIVLIRIFRRYFVASPPTRRVLTPVLFGGGVATLVVAWREISPLVLAPHTFSLVAQSASDAAETLIPIGLLIGFVRLHLERASVGALAADLTLAGAVRDQLQEVLAKRLGDRQLRVAFWSPDAGSYLDRDGLPLDLTAVDSTRTIRLLERDGMPDIAIVCDAALGENPGLLDQVGAVIKLAVANISARLPTGKVTFLSTDIEKSTELLDRLQGRRYGSVLSEHRRLLRQAVSRHHGYVVDSRADELFAAFTDSSDASVAAVEAQRELAHEHWSRSLGVKVRMGIHSGRPDLHEGAYVGLDVHHAIRVSAAAHGGQILLSESARSELGVFNESRLSIRPFGEHQLKGFPAPEMLYELVWPDSQAEVTPGLAGIPIARR